jgi:hypothetical protein
VLPWGAQSPAARTIRIRYVFVHDFDWGTQSPNHCAPGTSWHCGDNSETDLTIEMESPALEANRRRHRCDESAWCPFWAAGGALRHGKWCDFDESIWDFSSDQYYEWQG